MNKALVFVLVIACLAVAAIFLPLGEVLVSILDWIEANRSVAWLVFIVLYVSATVLLMPGSILTLAAGFLFGLVAGYLIVAVASVTGAACAFLIGRFFARDWVAAKLAQMPKFAALDRAIESRGGLIVLLTRLSPLFPFNLLNYALGLTKVRFWTYVGMSWVGMIPGTLLYVYLGSVASDLASIFAGEVADSPIGSSLFYVGLVATLVLTIVVTRIAGKELGQQLEEVS